MLCRTSKGELRVEHAESKRVRTCQHVSKGCDEAGKMLECTSRAGQAGGGSFKREKTIGQIQNLRIECAQGDQPVRCTNRGVCVQ